MKTSTPHTTTSEPAGTDLQSERAVPIPSEKARAVLAAARVVFLANGFSVATTDMIQRAAGVSKSTVYAHYPNKEALFKAVIEAECRQFMAGVREHKAAGREIRRVLTDVAKTFLDLILAPNILAVYRIIVSEGPRFPELAQRFYAEGPGAMNAFVTQTLEELMARGELDFGGLGIDAAATLFVNMVRGEPQMQCLTHPDSPPSSVQRDKWIQEAVTTFLRAFEKRAEVDR
jgi:AcrR family transcriptional regulator